MDSRGTLQLVINITLICMVPVSLNNIIDIFTINTQILSNVTQDNILLHNIDTILNYQIYLKRSNMLYTIYEIHQFSPFQSINDIISISKSALKKSALFKT